MMAYFSITAVSMQADDIKEQIEALRQEVRGLSKSILNLRQDDMRKVFGDQFKPVLTDRIARHFSSVKKGVRKEQEGASEVRLLDLVDRSVSMFQQHGKQRALKYLEEYERNVRARTDDHGRVTDRFETELISQIRDYLQLSDTIFSQTVPEGSSLDPRGTYSGNRALSPEDAERLLAPLSNARRVQVMLILSRESSSLAELCKELDLQKGHLQFHLKALLDVDYIQFDRKGHLYSLTSRGTIALQGVTKLVESLQPKNV
jgi:DNA-binding transcriptional ArsR family regulator